MRRLAPPLVALALLATVAAPTARAEAPPAPSPAAPPATPASATAVTRVARSLAAGLGAVPPGALVVAAPLASDEAAPRGDELARRVAASLAAALDRGARPSGETAPLPAARALAASAGTLVHVVAEVARGELRATADVFAVPRNAWDRVRTPEPPPSAHAFAAARVDAEVRAHLAPVPLVAARVERATGDERDVLALACGDVDGDGALELAVVGRRRVAVGRIRGQRFVATRAVAWADRSPVAPAPLREPLGGARVPPGGGLDVGSSDRARALHLDADLVATGALAGLPFGVPPLGGCLVPGTSRSTPVACAPGEALLDLGSAGAALDVAAALPLLDATGRALDVVATRDPDGTLTVRAGDAQTVVEGAGAQVALADLDEDGEPEIVASLDVLAPEGDAVVVRSWRPGDEPRERARIPVATGVRAIVACPPDAPGGAAIAIATGAGEMWIVR